MAILRPPRLSNLLRRTNPLRQAIAEVRNSMTAAREEIRAIATSLQPEGAPSPHPGAPFTPHEEPAATACLECVSNHLFTIGGALSEAVRFVRDKGVGDKEVRLRMAVALEEINIAERIDLHPSRVAQLSPKEQEVAHWILPKLRELRHRIAGVVSAEDIEKLSAALVSWRGEYNSRREECETCPKIADLKTFMERRERGAK